MNVLKSRHFCNLIDNILMYFIIYSTAYNHGQSSFSMSHNAGLSNSAFGAISIWKGWKGQKIVNIYWHVCFVTVFNFVFLFVYFQFLMQWNAWYTHKMVYLKKYRKRPMHSIAFLHNWKDPHDSSIKCNITLTVHNWPSN